MRVFPVLIVRLLFLCATLLISPARPTANPDAGTTTHASADTSTDSLDQLIRLERFDVAYRSAVPDTAAEEIARRIETAIAIVSGFLQQSQHYAEPDGAAFLRVFIHPDKGPYQIRNNIYLPEERVLNGHRDDGAGRTDLGIVHEVTHVLAESFGRANRDRFYDDGLAVYMQHRFGSEAGYPNFGTDLYIAFARAAKQHGEVIPLAQSETVRNARKSGTGRKLAYLQEGAFAQNLIDRFGLDVFLRIFYGESFESAVGESFGAIESDWRDLMLHFEIAAPID